MENPMAEVKHLDWRTLIAIKTAPEGTAEALDKYFEPFAQPPGKPDEGASRDQDHQDQRFCRTMQKWRPHRSGVGAFRQV
jgi:hypothetical protein